MADVRSKPAVKLVDPTTDANQAGVTAAGELKVSNTTALPAGTNNIGDVDVITLPALVAGTANIGDVDVLTMPGTFTEDAASGGGEVGHLALAVRNDAAASKTSADGDYSALAVDAAGRVGIADLGGSITIDGSVSITGSVDNVELPAAAALADATANPTVSLIGAPILGFNGTTWDRVRTANTGRLQVDVITGGGGGGSDAPTDPRKNRATSANVAAGASANLDSTQITSAKTGKLAQLMVSASVPVKVDVQTVLNNTGTTVATFFVPANNAFAWMPPHRNYVQQAESATAGLDGFRAVVTNNDNNSAADVYATFMWDEV